MSSPGTSSAVTPAATLEEEASSIFVQRLYGEWHEENQMAFEARLASDSAFAQAYRRVEESWRALDTHAEAPELMNYRAEAIEIMRRANAHRWFQTNALRLLSNQWKIAATIVGLTVMFAAWQLSPYGYRSGEYRTAIGEQRIVELDDHTRITLDAATHLQVHFTNDARSVQLLEGQAQFSVAKDPSRPFKVIAGGRTIVAVGTVFTVEYVQSRVHVAMIEGKVAVLAPHYHATEMTSRSAARGNVSANGGAVVKEPQVENEEIYLVAGEELHVAQDGQTVVSANADLEAATAWREGKVIFQTESLGEAVNRMNRYSHLQIQIDDEALAAKNISGVFEAGDTRGFVGALQHYFPVNVDYSDADTVRIRSK